MKLRPYATVFFVSLGALGCAGLVFALVFFFAAERWHPDVTILENMRRTCNASSTFEAYADFPQTVESHFDNLRQKKWDSVYERMAESYRKVVQKQSYLESAKKESENWQLKNYKILSIDRMEGPNERRRISMIVELRESIGNSVHTSHTAMLWEYDKGAWFCNIAGPKTPLFVFQQMVFP